MNNTAPIKLPPAEFLDSFKNVPRLAVNLLVVNHQGQFLLTKRIQPPFIGTWHLPGGYLLKNETLHECQKRIALEELNRKLADSVTPPLLGAIENITGDPRGHVVDLVYKILEGETAPIKSTIKIDESKFFSTIPENIGFNHQATLRALGYTD